MGIICLAGGQACVHFTGLFPHQVIRKLRSVALKLCQLIFIFQLLNNPTTQEITSKFYIL